MSSLSLMDKKYQIEIHTGQKTPPTPVAKDVRDRTLRVGFAGGRLSPKMVAFAEHIAQRVADACVEQFRLNAVIDLSELPMASRLNELEIKVSKRSTVHVSVHVGEGFILEGNNLLIGARQGLSTPAELVKTVVKGIKAAQVRFRSEEFERGDW